MTEAPLVRTFEHEVPAVVLGSDQTTEFNEAPYAGTVSAVNFVPVSAITGANTNTRAVSLINKGQAGSGTTVVATLEFDSGVNATANVPKALTLSGTAANLVVAQGDVLAWQSTHIGTGIADPGGLAHVEITRSATA